MRRLGPSALCVGWMTCKPSQPNLYIRRTPGIASGASITIRGIGTHDSDKSLDPAIGVMMDGVFLGTSSGVLMQNFDVERIEVLRGPQGTLYSVRIRPAV